MAYFERAATIPNTFSGRTGIMLLFAQGVLARGYVWNKVAVNGDTGLYIYDALQILWGQQMFVDFPGRSPVVQYILAGWLWFFPGHRLAATRGLMVIVGLLAGLAVYWLAYEIAGDKAGLAAMGLYLLTPFSLTWGVWMKTELFSALFGTAALALAVRYLDWDNPPMWASAVVGVLFGLTLLSRRVGFILVAALVLYTFWFRHVKGHHTLRSTLAGGLVAAIAGLGTLFGILFVMAGSVGLTWEFFDMYFLDLFRSGGFGAHGYLPLFGENYVNHKYANTGPNTLFQSICQKCGQRTIVVFIQTILATFVVLIPLLLWLKAYFNDRNPIEWLRWFLPAMLITQAVFGFVILIPSLVNWVEPEKGLALAVFAVAVALIWSVETPRWGDMTSPKVGIVFVVPAMLAIAYLYRDRVLYTTYWQDFYPTVSVLGGISLAAAWRVMGPMERPSISARRVRKVGAVVLVLAFYVSALGAYPFIGANPGPQFSNWYTVDRVEAYGWDVDRQLEDDELVFAANPLFVIESQHRLVGDLSRRYYLFEGWPETQVTKDLAADMDETLRSDRVPMAMMSSELQTVLAANETLNRTFHQEFCHVHDPLYETTEFKSLWVKRDHPRMPECGSEVERSDFVMDQL